MNYWEIDLWGTALAGSIRPGRTAWRRTWGLCALGASCTWACAGDLPGGPSAPGSDGGAGRRGTVVAAPEEDDDVVVSDDDSPPADDDEEAQPVEGANEDDDSPADDDSQPIADDLPPDVFADGSTVTTPPPGAELPACEAEAAASPLLKLSTLQYRNTVRDLLAAYSLGDVVTTISAPLGAIPDDSRTQRFGGLDDRISLEHVEGYYNVARAIGDAVAAEQDYLVALGGDCATSDTLDQSCLDAFLDDFGTSVVRRPLTDEEHAEYEALAKAAPDGPSGFRDVVVALLVSPRFVNHFEIDGARVSGTDDLLRLSPFEVASKLSYTFWQSMPDAELFEAARSGELSTDEGLQSQLDRIFDDPRVRDTLWTFWSEWFGLEAFTGFETGRPGFSALLDDLGLPDDHDYYTDMVNEVRTLTEMFTFEQPATLADLLLTEVSVTDSSELAAIYGAEVWNGTGSPPNVPQGSRAGLLQRSALLVSSLEQTNPFHRGAFVQRHLLCENLPSPDPAALPPGSLDIPATTATQTTRERFDAKVAGNDLCSTCHGLFSDTGYALESFDSLGGYRTSERVFDEQSGELLADLPLDVAADVRVAGEIVTITSPLELNRALAESGRVGACLAEQYFRFVNRRSATSGSSDACVAEVVAARLDESGAGLLGAFRHVAELQSFYQRRVGEQ